MRKWTMSNVWELLQIFSDSSYIFYTIKVIFIALSCIKPCMFRKSRQNGVMKGDSFEKDVDLRKMLKIEKKLKWKKWNVCFSPFHLKKNEKRWNVESMLKWLQMHKLTNKEK